MFFFSIFFKYNRNILSILSNFNIWTLQSNFGFYETDVIHKLEKLLTGKQLLQLERLFTYPYYIRNLKTIYLFSEQDYIMVTLHGGDLATYLNNLELS